MGSPPEISFVELMSLEKDKSGNRSETYISLVPSTGPGSGTAYGGHVFAQAVWAASQTVNKGMVVHVSLIAKSLIQAYLSESLYKVGEDTAKFSKKPLLTIHRMPMAISLCKA